MKKKIIITGISFLIIIFLSMGIFLYKKNQYQIADIYYYSSFEQGKIFKETISIFKKLNNNEKLTRMVNQILLGPKNSLEKGSQNKGIRCINAFYLNQTIFIYLDQNFILLTQNEIKNTFKSIAKTLDEKLKSKKKFLKIIVENFHFTENNKDQFYDFNNKISFEKILKN